MRATSPNESRDYFPRHLHVGWKVQTDHANAALNTLSPISRTSLGLSLRQVQTRFARSRAIR